MPESKTFSDARDAVSKISSHPPDGASKVFMYLILECFSFARSSVLNEDLKYNFEEYYRNWRKYEMTADKDPQIAIWVVSSTLQLPVFVRPLLDAGLTGEQLAGFREKLTSTKITFSGESVAERQGDLAELRDDLLVTKMEKQLADAAVLPLLLSRQEKAALCLIDISNGLQGVWTRRYEALGIWFARNAQYEESWLKKMIAANTVKT